MAQNISLRDFYYEIPKAAKTWRAPTADDLKAVFDGMDTKEKERLLLMPLSATTKENSLSYIIADGYIKDASSGEDQWRSDFLKTALDEIETIEPRANERLALLTSANEQGQTPFHKTLKYGDGLSTFDILTERLYKWGSDEFADKWLKSFLEQSFDTIEFFSSEKKNTTPLLQTFPGEMFDRFLDLHQKFNPKTSQQLADYVFEQLSKQDTEGNTAMHQTWQYSLFMGPPGSPGAVNDHLGTVIASFDKRFGETIALDLTTKLLLLENKEGALPLDEFPYSDNIKERDCYIGGFLFNLRKELGSAEKFKTYVTEIIASVLPPDFTIKLGSYEPEPEPGAEPPKPKRGAIIEP